MNDIDESNNAYMHVKQMIASKEDQLEVLIAEIETLQYILENHMVNPYVVGDCDQ